MPANLQILITAEAEQALRALQQAERGVQRLDAAARNAGVAGLSNAARAARGLNQSLQALNGVLHLTGSQRLTELSMGLMAAQYALQGLRNAAVEARTSLVALGGATIAGLLGGQKIVEFIEESIALYRARSEVEQASAALAATTAANMARAYQQAIKAVEEGRLKLTEQEAKWLDELAARPTPEGHLAMIQFLRQRLPPGEFMSEAERQREVSARLAAFELTRAHGEAQLAYNHALLPIEAQRLRIQQQYADTERLLGQLREQGYLTELQARDRLIEADTRRLAQLAELRDLELSRIEASWRLTEAQKWSILTRQGLPGELLGPSPYSFLEQLGAQSVAMLNQIGTAAQNAAAIVTQTIGVAFSRIGDTMADLILGAKTWGQALAQVGRQLLSTVLGSFTQFFANILARAVLNAIVGATIQKAAALSAAAAWAGPAILAATATYGAAAAQAPAAVATALASAPALSVMATATPRAKGGPVQAGRLYLVGERGPELFVPEQSGYILPHMAGGPANPAGRVGAQPIVNDNRIKIAIFDDPSRIRDFWRSEEGRAIFVDLLRQHAHEVGLV